MPAGGIGAALGLGVVLSMANRLSGPAGAASASMKTLTMQTERARLSQMRFETAVRAGTIALVGGAGAVLALGLVVNQAAQFETGMARVSAVLDPTTSQLKALTAAAIEAGIKTQFSPRQATQGLKELATAGFTAEEAMVALVPVLDFATGSLGQLGVAEAAASASAAIRGFGFDVSETARIVDTLLRSTQLTNIQARDLQVMLARVSGNARAAGQEFEHTVAVLGALRNTGAEASVSATTLRSALRAMTQTKATSEMDKLGVSLFDNQGNFRDLATVIFDLEKRLSTVTEKERNLSLMAIFGARGLNTFNAVAGLGVAKFASLEAELKNASGTAADFRKKTLEPLSGRLVLLGGSIATLATQLGTPLLAPLKFLVSALTKFLNLIIKITLWFPNLTKVVMLIVGLVASISALVGGVILLTTAIIALNMRYGLLAKAKAAYLFISKLVFGMDGLSRKQIIGLMIAEQFRITQVDILNAKTKIKIFLERLLGIGITKRTSITWAGVHAAWAERAATVGNNVAIGIQNTLKKINTLLSLKNIGATWASARSQLMSSRAMVGASAGAGVLTGALKGLWAVIVANPILALIAVVVVAIIIFVKLARAFWDAKGATQALFAVLLVMLSPLGTLIILAKLFSEAFSQNLGGVKTAFIEMKKAIMSIFAPLDKFFSAAKGVGPMGKLFKSVMSIVMIPFARAFRVIAIAATAMGAVGEIIVQEFEAAFTPLVPVIDQLSAAFDEFSIAIFGKGKKQNLTIWKTFGSIVRWVAKSAFEPMAKVIVFIARSASKTIRILAYLLAPLKQAAEYIAQIAASGISNIGGFLGTVGGYLGLQHGGLVRGGAGGTLAAVGEGSRDELVTPLPTGLRPEDLATVFRAILEGRSPAPAAVEGTGVPTTIVLENRIFLDGREIMRSKKEISELEGLRSFF